MESINVTSAKELVSYCFGHRKKKHEKLILELRRQSVKCLLERILSGIDAASREQLSGGLRILQRTVSTRSDPRSLSSVRPGSTFRHCKNYHANSIRHGRPAHYDIVCCSRDARTEAGHSVFHASNLAVAGGARPSAMNDMPKQSTRTGVEVVVSAFDTGKGMRHRRIP